MFEEEVKKTVKKFLNENNFEFLEEVNLGGSIIDFLYKKDGNWFGIEAKGTYANKIKTLGQLINYYKYLSHIILCAPRKFIDKFKELLDNPEIKIKEKTGFLSIEGDGGIIIVQPKNQGYYFKISKKNRIKSRQYKYPKYGVLDKVDESILEIIKEKQPITLGEIILKLERPYESTRKRIKNLEHFGFLKILSKNPIVVGLERK